MDIWFYPMPILADVGPTIYNQAISTQGIDLVIVNGQGGTGDVCWNGQLSARDSPRLAAT